MLAMSCQSQGQQPTISTAELASNDVDVVIVGGGPSGLATAAALRQALGGTTSIRVFESRAPSGEGGATIRLDVNGMRALEAIDPRTAHKIYERGIYNAGMSLHDDVTGEPLNTATAPRRPDFAAQLAEHGHVSVMMAWWDFAQALEEALPPGVVHHGLKLVECVAMQPDTAAAAASNTSSEPRHQEEGFRYRLTLQRCAIAPVPAGSTEAASAAGPGAGGDGPGGGGDGTVVVRARWLIGADGYFSRVRRQVGDGCSPVPSGEVLWWGTLREADLTAAGATWPGPLRDLQADTARSAGYSPQQGQGQGGGAAPLRVALLMRAAADGRSGVSDGGGGGGAGGGLRDRGFWYLRAREEELERAERELRDAAGALGDGAEQYGGPSPSSGGALRRALATFRHLPADVLAFLAATPPGRVTERRLCLHDLQQRPQAEQAAAWTDGRGMVLVGDAAHAGRPDGQGANLGLEDAAVLGELVRRHGLGPQAFSAFEEARWPRVRDILAAWGPARTTLVNAAAFPPLWSPPDLGLDPAVQVDDVEDGLAWSRGRVRDIVMERLYANASTSSAGSAAATAAPMPPPQQQHQQQPAAVVAL